MENFEENNKLYNVNLNMGKRSEILEYALNIEDSINTLLLLYLSITDKSKTKLFGNKVGISFKNKIDLLYDIDVLSKEEHSDLKLQMIFRNKFLHDINCESFTTIISQLDNGIKNKFKKHLCEHGEIEEEESCRKAYLNLFVSNLRVIRDKLVEKENLSKEKCDFLQTSNKLSIKYIDFYFDLVSELLLLLESFELEDPKIAELANIIGLKCKQHINKLQTDIEIVKLQENYSEQIINGEKFKRFLK